MDLIYEGKTKNIYKGEDGNYLLKFKDDVTGRDGVFDPGANQVGLSIEGMGNAGLRLTVYFFEILKKLGVSTHYVSSDIDNNIMTVKPATVFGKGLEVICRYKAVGSFIRRYGLYAKEGQDLNGYVEFTLKDDDRNDPLITKEGLEVLSILKNGEYETIVALTKKICYVIRGELAKKGLELYDIKLEFGRVAGEEKVVLIDEISAGNMRVYKNGKIVKPLELAKLILG